MAGGRESGRQEDKIGASAVGAAQVRDRVGGTGHRAGVAGRDCPAAAPQMHAHAKFRCQSWVSGHDQHQPAVSADCRQILRQGWTPWVLIVAQDDAGPAPRQPGDGGARIGQALVVGEQPQAWQLGAWQLGAWQPGGRHRGVWPAQAPGQQFLVHPDQVTAAPRPRRCQEARPGQTKGPGSKADGTMVSGQDARAGGEAPRLIRTGCRRLFWLVAAFPTAR
jgi:hypothetical protein